MKKLQISDETKQTLERIWRKKSRKALAILLTIGLVSGNVALMQTKADQTEEAQQTALLEESRREAGLLVGEDIPTVSDGDSKTEDTESDDIEETEEPGDSREGVLLEADLDSEIQEEIALARTDLQQLTADYEIMALVYLTDSCPLRSEPWDGAQVLHQVYSGQTVFIQDITITAVDGDYQAWAYVTLYDGESTYQGYLPRYNLACSDERFLNWEEMYGMNPTSQVALLAEEPRSGVSADIAQFPASYQPALTALKEKHPEWIFVPMNTGLDWNTAIANELVGGKSLVSKSYPAYDKEGAYDNGNWFYASEDILKLYMDPRNALTEDAIFQFEQLTYNESYHTQEALEKFLQNTFMKNGQNAPGTEMTYSKIIWSTGRELNVSPFHLAARIYQEQGAGTSPLISGTYPGYEGYYNYFNIRATGKSNEEVIRNGLEYAKNATPFPWNSAYYSIYGGSQIIAKNYIQKGQSTLYLQKFNVNPHASNALYTHQYMQNIAAPTSEARTVKNLYASANALTNSFVFNIPVFNNMPASPCPMPTSSTNAVLQIPSGYDTTVYIDGIACYSDVRNGRYITKTGKNTATSAVVYRYNGNGVPVGMYVWTLKYENNAYTVTPQPDLADLLTYHGFSIRITGKSGIRFKTGISTDLRAKLVNQGIDGYKLKEYGTLVMNQANRSQYPLIKGGAKVLGGMSYGINEKGTLDDKIYEVTDGRYRYTSVLVGLPAQQYKTEYAFRGYAVLEKNGVETTIYGPAVAKSIYALANQVVNAGTYPQGSDADKFLRQLIADADAVQ